MVSNGLCAKTGQGVKTDSKLIRATIQIAHKSITDEHFELIEIAEKVVREDGRTASIFLQKSKLQ